MVCERAALRITRSHIAYCHQALSVVDWCKARIQGCTLTGNGNALWFGNRCDVELEKCKISECINAFSLRTVWDRGTSCLDREQDIDNGGRARLVVHACSVDGPAFEAGRLPGTFVNTSSTFTLPQTPFNASLVRPPLPYIKDPYAYHMKNLHRNDTDFIETFGADPGLVHRNPDFREPVSTPFHDMHPWAAPASHEGPYSVVPPIDERS
ncbi:hypothetical protein T484DRAFT_1955708 [Baffinella frigidus]|nr:hypothetical protein T484DRAFT_1955708 [Cryptophyta sp. CCMP2293]